MNKSFSKFLLFLLALLFASQAQAVTRDPAENFFHQSLGDFQEEIEIAIEENKKAILIMFEEDDCPWCRRMKKIVLNQPEVQDYFRKNFQIFAVDTQGDVEIIDFNGDAVSMKDFSFKQHRVRATPVFAFFGLDGQLLKRARFTGASSSVEEFMLLGKFIVEGINEKMSFTRYKRSLKNKNK